MVIDRQKSWTSRHGWTVLIKSTRSNFTIDSHLAVPCCFLYWRATIVQPPWEVVVFPWYWGPFVDYWVDDPCFYMFLLSLIFSYVFILFIPANLFQSWLHLSTTRSLFVLPLTRYKRAKQLGRDETDSLETYRRNRYLTVNVDITRVIIYTYNQIVNRILNTHAFRMSGVSCLP